MKGLLQLLWIPAPLDAEQALQQTLVDLHAFLSGLVNWKEWVGALDGKGQSLWRDALAQENIDVALVRHVPIWKALSGEIQLDDSWPANLLGVKKQIPYEPCERTFLGACGFQLFLLLLLEEPEASYSIVTAQDVPDIEMARNTMQQNWRSRKHPILNCANTRYVCPIGNGRTSRARIQRIYYKHAQLTPVG